MPTANYLQSLTGNVTQYIEISYMSKALQVVRTRLQRPTYVAIN